MAYPRYEVPAGVIDGVNTVFTTLSSYVPGSTAYFLNGQLKRPDYDDGWVETSPAGGVFTVKEAPEVDDVVQLFYLDSTISLVSVEEVCDIMGILVEEDDAIEGQVEDESPISGAVEEC